MGEGKPWWQNQWGLQRWLDWHEEAGAEGVWPSQEEEEGARAKQWGEEEGVRAKQEEEEGNVLLMLWRGRWHSQPGRLLRSG